jgi:VanZ family protein
MLPWLLPGIAIAFVVGLAAGGAVGRFLGVHRAVALLMLLGLGIIVAATLTPWSSPFAPGAPGPARCDFSRIGAPSWEELRSIYDAGGNILMFIPLGAAIGLLPRSRRKAAIVVAAVALPFAIETIQLAVPWLDRQCESADVVDNLTGLLLGLVAGTVAGRFARRMDRRPG